MQFADRLVSHCSKIQNTNELVGQIYVFLSNLSMHSKDNYRHDVNHKVSSNGAKKCISQKMSVGIVSR